MKWTLKNAKGSRVTVEAKDINAARERAAEIGLRDPESIILATEAATDAARAVEAFELGLLIHPLRPGAFAWWDNPDPRKGW